MTKDEIELLIMAVDYLPILPKSRFEGRKKVRGYVRKMKAARKDRKLFFRELMDKAIPDFLCAVMEKHCIINEI